MADQTSLKWFLIARQVLIHATAIVGNTLACGKHRQSQDLLGTTHAGGTTSQVNEQQTLRSSELTSQSGKKNLHINMIGSTTMTQAHTCFTEFHDLIYWIT